MLIAAVAERVDLNQPHITLDPCSTVLSLGPHQQYSQQSEQDFRGRPLRQVEGGQQILNKVIKQRPEIIFLLPSTAPAHKHTHNVDYVLFNLSYDSLLHKGGEKGFPRCESQLITIDHLHIRISTGLVSLRVDTHLLIYQLKR